MKQSKIIGLDEYGLALNDLKSLKSKKVNLHIHLKHAGYKLLAKNDIKSRRKKYYRYLKSNLNKAIRFLGEKKYTLIGKRFAPSAIEGIFPLKMLIDLLKEDFFDYVNVKEISGLKKLKSKTLGWYSVEATFIIQIEGLKKGKITVEKKVMIFLANGQVDAKKKFLKHAKDYSEPYVNHQMRFVRWKLKKIDKIEYIADSIDPTGTEVFSECVNKLMKKEDVWK